MPHISNSRGDHYYADHRRADTPPLLLIHGAAGTHLDWSMPIRKMGSIAVDLCGHGKSPGYGRETIAEYAEDMVALLDALELETTYVCGHSMGGAIALTIALEHADRVRGLVLISTGARLRVHPEILTQAESNPAGVADLLFSWLWATDTDESARARGRALFLAQKPIVIARDHGETVEARVHPALVPAFWLLADVNGAKNAVYVQSYALERIDGVARPRVERHHARFLWWTREKPLYTTVHFCGICRSFLARRDNWKRAWKRRLLSSLTRFDCRTC